MYIPSDMFQLVLCPVEGDWLITEGVYSWADRAMLGRGGGPQLGNAGKKKIWGAKKNLRAKKKEKNGGNPQAFV
jgi:hypothetical protein